MSPAFYVTGGTLEPTAPCYVQRSADLTLFDSLLQGEFCYLLDARQLGKSSLMARTSTRLRGLGVRTAVIDLSAVGTNVTLSQWYYGLLTILCAELGLGAGIRDHWKDQEDVGPLQRWFSTLTEVVLPRIEDKLVIFIDEIDVVRSLPFSTDEFFAGIRECYNRRPKDIQLQKLAFCLVGVATPAELIRSSKMTPFNVGKRINLVDFSLQEAAPLAEGLAGSRELAESLLERVLTWTGGHPYLTQRLCKAISERHEVRDAEAVDRLCHQLFLSSDGRETDDNLLFVRERLLEAPLDSTKILLLYLRVRRKSVKAKDVPPALLAQLLLTGIVKVERGVLRVRNRLYSEVFDSEWVYDNLPGAEQRRLRKAFRTGVFRASGAFGLIVLLLVSILIYAYHEASLAKSARNDAVLASDAYHHLLYDSETLMAGEYLNDQPPAVAEVRQILQDSKESDPDLRGFEWGLLWNLVHGEPMSYSLRAGGPGGQAGPEGPVQVAFGHDGAVVYSSNIDGAPTAWDVPDRGMMKTSMPPENARQVVESGGVTAYGFASGVVQIHRKARVATGDRRIRVSLGPLGSVLLSDSGDRLMTMDVEGNLALWNTVTGGKLCAFDGVKSGALSRDGTLLAAITTPPPSRGGSPSGNTVMLWDSEHGWRTVTRSNLGARWSCLTFDPSASSLLVANALNSRELFLSFRTSDCSLIRTISPENLPSVTTCAVVFGPDGKRLFAGCSDGRIDVWDMATNRVLLELAPTSEGIRKPGDKASRVVSIARSADGLALAAGYADRSVHVWLAAQLDVR